MKTHIDGSAQAKALAAIRTRNANHNSGFDLYIGGAESPELQHFLDTFHTNGRGKRKSKGA